MNVVSFEGSHLYNSRVIPKTCAAGTEREELLKQTIVGLLNRNPEDLLKGRTLAEVAARVSKHLDLAKNQQDVELLTLLILHDGDRLLAKVNERYNCHLEFGDLYTLAKRNPQKKVGEMIVYLVAQRDPHLAGYAEKLFGEEQRQPTLTDPHIQYVEQLQQRIKLTRLEPEELYRRRNEADAEFAELQETQLETQRAEQEKNNHRRLAHLEIASKDSLRSAEQHRRAKLKEALGLPV